MSNMLQTKTAEEILTTVFKPKEFIIDGLLVCKITVHENEEGSLDVNLEFNGDFKDTSTVCFEIKNRYDNSRREYPAANILSA